LYQAGDKTDDIWEMPPVIPTGELDEADYLGEKDVPG